MNNDNEDLSDEERRFTFNLSHFIKLQIFHGNNASLEKLLRIKNSISFSIYHSMRSYIMYMVIASSILFIVGMSYDILSSNQINRVEKYYVEKNKQNNNQNQYQEQKYRSSENLVVFLGLNLLFIMFLAFLFLEIYIKKYDSYFYKNLTYFHDPIFNKIVNVFSRNKNNPRRLMEELYKFNNEIFYYNVSIPSTNEVISVPYKVDITAPISYPYMLAF